MAVGQLAVMSNGQPSSRASSAPTRVLGWRQGVCPPIPVWERACSRWRWVCWRGCQLGSRHREQARLPQGFSGGHRVCVHHPSSVGASLLAMAVGLLAMMSNGQPSSRASSAPTRVLGWRQGLCPPLIPVWELGCRRGGLCLYWCCTCTIELTCTRACICSAPPPRRMPRTGQASR